MLDGPFRRPVEVSDLQGQANESRYVKEPQDSVDLTESATGPDLIWIWS
jgi:hypothetical protein